MNGYFVRLSVALLLPLVILVGYWLHLQHRYDTGVKITLPISSFRPLKLQYPGGEPKCDVFNKDQTVYVCLKGDPAALGHLHFSIASLKQAKCQIYLQGNCVGNNPKAMVFDSGINEFYVPENEVYNIIQAVNANRGQVVLRVDEEGNATIHQLLIDNKPWQEVIY